MCSPHWFVINWDSICSFILQDMENKIRNTLNDIYFGKTKDIVNGLRSTTSLAEQKQRENMSKDLAAALTKRSTQQSNN